MCLTGLNQQSAAQPGNQGLPFCSFCLREKSPDQDFYKTITDCAPELRQSFQTMLGYDFQLVNFSICRPCWKLMQLVQDIRVRCFKANEAVGFVRQGFASGDGWFSAKTLASFESTRIMMKDHTKQIEKLVAASTSSGDDNLAQEVQEDAGDDIVEEQQITIDDDDADLVSEISVEETKLEPLVDDSELCSIQIVEQHSLMSKSQKISPHHECKFCLKRFNRKSYLQNHLNKHTGTKPFKCGKHCNKEFFSANAKYKHERICITDPKKKCSICKLQFSARSELIKHHMLSHPGEVMAEGASRFPCKYCCKVFMNLKVLAIHRQTHADLVATHPCKQCDRVFLHAKSLVIHVKNLHGNDEVSD